MQIEKGEKGGNLRKSGATTGLKALKEALKLLLAGGIIAFLVHKMPRDFWDAFLHAGSYWLAAALALFAVHIFANAWRWRLLLRAQKIECSLFLACSLTMQSFFFSLILPGGALGGDLMRIGFITSHVPKGRKFDGAFTILIDRFTGMIGIFLVALGMLPLVWDTIVSVKGVVEPLIYLLLAGSLAGIAASVVVFNHRWLERSAFYRKLGKFGDRATRGIYSRVTAALDSYGGCRRELVICILASIVLVNLVLGVEAWCIARAVTKPEATPGFGVALAAITLGNIAGLLPLTPSGVGMRDFFVVKLLQAGGMAYDGALAVSLTQTAIILLFNLSGGVFFLLPGPKKTAEAPGDECN